MHSILKITKLQKKFLLHNQNGAVLDVLRGISLEVGEREIVALCGPSGIGKSSLLKALYGTYRVNGGTIEYRLDDHWLDLTRATAREILNLRKMMIGYVSQFLRVIPRVPTLDIVAEPAIELGESEEAARQRAADLLDKLRIPEELFSLSPLTFSGGEQQRVNIARALSAPRKLTLFDEPTASLDPVNRQTVLEMIAHLRESGNAIVGIFHDARDREILGAREIDLSIQDELSHA